ncbi:asparagine--tRNA ligase [Patescibacteria group bacterium]
MEIFLKDIDKYDKKKVTLNGWLFNKRSSGKIHFLQIRDGTGFIQVIVEKDKVGENLFNKCTDLTIESSVELVGKVKEDKRAPSGFEMDLVDLKILQLAHEYPLQKKEHGTEFLLDHRHLWLRSTKQWAIQRVRNTIINAIYEHLNSQGFIKIDSPILTPNACEGTTTLFEVPYTPAWKDGAKDGPKAYLSQSGQLYLEAAIMSHGRVFDFGPTFRAEKSKTRRHLTEFWMMDAEAAFVDHRRNMKIQEELTVTVVKKVLSENKNELNLLERDIKALEPSVKGDYKIITHKEAIKKLPPKADPPLAGTARDDLGAEDETILSKEYDRPFFIEKYPKEIKAFYMKEDPKDKTRVLCADMLAPEGYGEIVGGSQREDDYDKLLKRIKEKELNVKDFEWYLDLRKYGSVPHSGFGIGLERYVAWICGLKHIRETIPFPRMIHRLKP